MPSNAYHRWETGRAAALDEIEAAHAAIGGTGPGRRYATQQINRAYAVLLAAEFQGFCRDLHSESVRALARGCPAALQPIVAQELAAGRKLDRGNATPSNLGADFGRLGVRFWDEVRSASPVADRLRRRLELLNEWRNAVAHQDFDPDKLGGTVVLRLSTVRAWRKGCARLARVFDQVLRGHLTDVTGVIPWA